MRFLETCTEGSIRLDAAIMLLATSRYRFLGVICSICLRPDPSAFRVYKLRKPSDLCLRGVLPYVTRNRSVIEDVISVLLDHDHLAVALIYGHIRYCALASSLLSTDNHRFPSDGRLGSCRRTKISTVFPWMLLTDLDNDGLVSGLDLYPIL